MSEGYNPDLSDALSRMRAALGDTDPAAPLLPNDTYTAALAAAGNVERVAVAQLARYLIARFAQLPSRMTTGGDTVEWKDRLVAWQALVDADVAVIAAASGGMQAHRPERSDLVSRGAEYWRRRDGY